MDFWDLYFVPGNKNSGERAVVLFFTSEALIKFALIIKTKNT